jgi:hypothetical protein
MRTLKLYVSDSVTRDRIEKIAYRLTGQPAQSTRVWMVTHDEISYAEGHAIKSLLEDGRHVPDVNWEAVRMRTARLNAEFHARRQEYQTAVHSARETCARSAARRAGRN